MGLITSFHNGSRERRQSPRHRVFSIVYVQFDTGNGGIVVNLGVDGLAFQAACKLPAEQNTTLNFRLRGAGLNAELTGDVVWLGATQREAGICFRSPSANLQKDIADWIAEQEQKCQMVASGEQLKPTQSIPGTTKPRETVVSHEAPSISRAIGTTHPARQDANAGDSRVLTFRESTAGISGTMPLHREHPLLRRPSSELSSIEDQADAPSYNSSPIVLGEPAKPEAREVLTQASGEFPSNSELREVESISREDSTAAPQDSPYKATTKRWIPSTLIAAWKRRARHQKLMLAGVAAGYASILYLILILTAVHVTRQPDRSVGSGSPQSTKAAPATSSVAGGSSHPETQQVQLPPARHRDPQPTSFLGGLVEFVWGSNQKTNVDDGVEVWISKSSGYYYCADSPYYQKVQPGALMTQGSALQSGYQPRLGQACD